MKYLFLFITVFIVFSIPSCMKYNPFGETYLEVYAYNPVTREPIEGIGIKLVELEVNKYNESKVDSTIIFEAQTNHQGLARYDFLPKNYNSRFEYDYVVLFDYSTAQLPPGNYVGVNQLLPYYIAYFQTPLVYPIKIVPQVYMVVEMKNVNCTGTTDSMRVRRKYVLRNNGQWLSWTNYIVGCYDHTSNVILTEQDSIYWEMEIIRNGVTSYIRDSIFLDPNNVVDTVKYHY